MKSLFQVEEYFFKEKGLRCGLFDLLVVVEVFKYFFSLKECFSIFEIRKKREQLGNGLIE